MAKQDKSERQEQPLNEVFAELETIVKNLSQEENSLEDSFTLYNQGMNLLKVCNDKIDTVEKKILVLDENGEKHEF